MIEFVPPKVTATPIPAPKTPEEFEAMAERNTAAINGLLLMAELKKALAEILPRCGFSKFDGQCVIEGDSLGTVVIGMGRGLSENPKGSASDRRE